MELKLTKVQTKVILDALVESIAFDDTTEEVKDVYNTIVKQANIEGYEVIG